MRVLMSDKALHCKHTALVCKDCDSIAWKERRRSSLLSKRFLRLASSVKKSFEQQTKRLHEEEVNS